MKTRTAEHPLKRIMAVEEKDGAMLVTTTDIHLARGIGEALHHAYQGELQYHYNPEQNSVARELDALKVDGAMRR